MKPGVMIWFWALIVVMLVVSGGERLGPIALMRSFSIRMSWLSKGLVSDGSTGMMVAPLISM